MTKITPMMQQYHEIKKQHEDAFLFFRLGDFYELFFEDAVLAAHELEITLTRRGKGEDAAPMCGVPYHSAENYISRLIDKGYKIAICEQVEDPLQAKGVVKREVIRVITPGTVMEGKVVAAEENNYIAAIAPAEDGTTAYVRTDLTTGETSGGVVAAEVAVLEQALFLEGLKEVIFPEKSPAHLQDWKESAPFTVSFENEDTIPENYQHLYRGRDENLARAFGRMLVYLGKTQKRALAHLQPLQMLTPNAFMQMDVHTRRNLELTASLRERGKKGSLFELLDRTVTAMGGRQLRRWIEQPLYSREEIERRLDIVTALLDDLFTRDRLQEHLRSVYDLERLAGKVAYGNVNARELVQLRRSLQQVPVILELLPTLGAEAAALAENIDPCEPLMKVLADSLVDEPPLSIREGGMIRTGYHEDLDQYREATENGKQWISELEQSERVATGIKSLKVGFNRVFGYYLEVSKANIDHAPDHYERKQTLTNAERFVTPELKEMESRILEAEEKMETLELDLFQTIREKTKPYIPALQTLAKMIAALDVLQSFAAVSENQRYTRPQFTRERTMTLSRSRHPVVENTLPSGEYVANAVHFDDTCEMLLITGPNMAGKSTYMRQIAMITVMAQMGCYVPAEKAVMPLFDHIFTRIGATDDLASGHSTFMVEMLESEYALRQATENSLILLDEIGRGTSTYDGMAIARAMIEYIHEHIGAKTLFSTHYHELTVLEQDLDKLENIHVSATEEEGRVVFLHKVKKGRADKSYGIHVAQLANLPDEVIQRAQALLHDYEQGHVSLDESGEVAASVQPESNHEQLALFIEEHDQNEKYQSNHQMARVAEAVREIDVLHLSPLAALEAIYEWQRQLRNS